MAPDPPTHKRPIRRFLPIAVAALLLTGASRAAAPPADSEPAGGMHRLTEAQYRNAIADIFGEDIEVAGRIRQSAMSRADLEEYERMARGIATQVVDERHRAVLVACAPRDVTLADDDCAARFFRLTGGLVFRRPLSTADAMKQVAAAREATKLTRDFYAGLGASLAAMLVSPRFLFDIDVLEQERGRQRLDAYSKASRVSLFLWGTTPDTALLEAAARGDLHTAPGLARQVDRLLASPRVDSGVKAFFTYASADVEGCDLKEPARLEQTIRNDPAVPACLPRKVSEYAMRRPLHEDEAEWITEVTAQFARDGYQLRPLLRTIATSNAFFRVLSPPTAPGRQR